MSTNAALKKLLKKKNLTGDEVGKLVLMDMVSSHKGEPTLSKLEIDTLASGFTNNQDITTYNDYVKVSVFLGALAVDHQLSIHRFTLSAVLFLNHINTLQEAEQSYFKLTLQPRIITKRDYEAAVAATKKEIRQYTYSAMDLMEWEVNQHIERYENGESTIYNPYFEKAKKEDISLAALERCSALWGDAEKFKGQSKYDLLKESMEVYSSMETDISGIELEFKEDYPELVQAIFEKYGQLEGLGHLTNITDKQFIKEDLISFKTAYDLDILGAKKTYDEPSINFNGHNANSGLAVIAEPISKWLESNIKDGTYYYMLGNGLGRHLAEDVLGNFAYRSQIEDLKRELKNHTKTLQAFNYSIDLLIDITGVKELEVFKRINGEDTLQQLNEASKIKIGRYGLVENERDAAQLTSQIEELFKLDFTIEDVQVNAEEREKAAQLIKQASSKQQATLNSISYLTSLKA